MDAVTELVDETRLLYHRLVDLAHELHGESGVTPAQRAVLEYLHRHGPTTVPGVARARGVTRQHIQATANDLARAGLVRTETNPAHRRSGLLTLTERGARSIAEVLRRERAHGRTRLADLDEERLRDAARTLAAVRSRL